ncbi:MAG: tail fiber protein [FCB group bacterium]|nr:tail fiber protein [FCB group bacterium]
MPRANLSKIMCALTLLSCLAVAEVPALINYQGRLTDTEGEPAVDGNYLLTFTIWNDPASVAPEAKKWSSGIRGVDVSDGLFSYNLGDSIALPHDLFSANPNLWLGVTVSTDAEISPRTKMISVGTAYHALRSDTSAMATDVADLTISSSKIMDFAVTEMKLANLAVTENKMATQSVTEDKLASGSVTSDKLGTQAVTTVKIHDDAVTEIKIADQSVTSVKLATDAVSTSNILNNAVTTDKVATDAVTTTQIAAGTIQFSDIGSNGAADNQVMMRDGGMWVADNPIPTGVIVMWSGTLATIPEGWLLCDGNYGTPNLQDKFIYGVTSAEEPGGTGGAASSSHAHSIDGPAFNTGGPSSVYTQVWEAGGQHVASNVHTHSADPPAFSSSSSPVNTIPPYFKLAFIMKQ